MILLAIVIFFCLVYAVLVICFGINWLSIPEFIAGKQNRDLRFSVVIPARNEERNLPLLLKALQEQDYPHDHFEIIVVDDHSSDDTLNIAASFNGVKAVSLQGDNINSYKKKAIETGISVARYEW